MKKYIRFLGIIMLSISIFSSCSLVNGSKIEGVEDKVYQRGIEFIEYMDNTKMIGEQEGLEMLNAISPDGGSDTDDLFEDDIYILWIYHNLKSVDSAAAEINKSQEKMGINITVQEQYKNIRNQLYKAKTRSNLQEIYDSVVANNKSID